MKYFMLPQIAGVMKDLHARGIPQQRCQDALNVMFEEGRVKTRWGYREISANLPLSGPITHIVEFEKIYSGEKFLVVCTTRDIYYWNMNQGIFVPLTEVISGSVGTIEYNTADGLVSTVEHGTGLGPLNPSTMPFVGTYRIRFNCWGLWAHDNLVSHIESDDELVLDEDYFWIDYLAFNSTPTVLEYACIELLFCMLPVGESLGNWIAYNDETETYYVRQWDGYTATFSGGDSISDSEHIALFSYARDDGEVHGYILFNQREAVSCVGSPTSGANTITLSSYSIIPIGSIIRVASYTRYGITATNFYTHYVVTAFNDDTGILTYEPLNVDTPGSPGGIYTICNSSAEGTTAVTFSLIHEYAQIPNITSGTRASVRCGSFPDGFGSLPFELRLCDSGDIDDAHDSAIIYDVVEEDKVIALTNGIQPVRYWSGTGEVRRLGERSFTGDLTSGSNQITNCDGDDFVGVRENMNLSGTGVPSGATIDSISGSTITMTASAAVTDTDVAITAFSYPNAAKYIDYFGSVGYEHVILANTTDGTSHNAQTVEMSDAGEIDLWNSIYFDLIDTNDPVVGIKRLGTRLMIYKQNSITEAWPNPSGGNVDPFDFNQNKVNVGTPSIRTVVDFGDFHVFFGWDNIYVFNGIGITPIGSDIMNDLNAGVNRPFINRAFAFSVPNKNLYCLFVPYGFDVENCNRAYIYNYVEKHWSIWQLSHEMTCFGTFHQSEAPTWDEWLVPVSASGTTTISSTSVTMSSVDGIDVGNVVEATTGIPADTNVVSIVGTTITLSNAATATGSRTLSFYKSWENMLMRWEDLILYEDNERWILGDVNGNIYEISDREFDDNGNSINAYFITRDFPLNDEKQNFRLLQGVIGICNEIAGSFIIEASVDFGRTWTAPIAVAVAEGSDYIENICNWIERGRQVRFRITNVNGSFFKLESLNIGYVDAGITTIQGA